MKIKFAISPVKLFFIISFTGIILFLIYSFLTGNHAILWLAQENDTNMCFSDYFMHIYYSADRTHLYEITGDDTGCFPPFAYLLYFFLYKMTYMNRMPSSLYDVRDADGAMVVFVYYSIMVAVILLSAIVVTGVKNEKLSLLLFLSLMFSAPFVSSGFFMGNSTMLVLGLLVLALALKDSEKLYLRQAGLIIIAICAGFKIYPAVFGLLYLKDKRYKEAIELTIFGILFFAVPFAFFGGLNGAKLWLGHIMSTMGFMDFGRIQCIRGAVFTLFSFLGCPEKITSVITTVAPWIFLVLMIVLASVSQSKKRTVFFLTAAMVFFPTNSFRYTLGYLAIPLIMHVKETAVSKVQDKDMVENNSKNIFSRSQYVIMALFGLLFSIPIWWGIVTGFELTFPYFTLTYVELYMYVIAYILLIFVTVVEIVLQVSQKHKKKDNV